MSKLFMEYAQELESLKTFISSLMEERRNSSNEKEIDEINADLDRAYNRKYYLLKILSK